MPSMKICAILDEILLNYKLFFYRMFEQEVVTLNTKDTKVLRFLQNAP
jgi:hypothetical protein